jgi:hypothetical protein
MMYESKLAAAIKVGGKVLREFKDTVYIPFASEYSILLKNLNTTRAVVNVFIDGENAVPGGLVIDPGREVDLERWIKNGNLAEGNRFKFIERTGSVEQHRGIGIEDGLVRIEFQFEKIFKRQDGIQWTNTGYNNAIYPQGGILRGSSADVWPTGSVTCSTASYDATSVNSSHAVLNNVGITVPGSHSSQKFSTAYVGTLESEKHSMVFKLLGGTVPKPITVKHKPKCVTCGKQNKATSKFCQECGTALEIFA